MKKYLSSLVIAAVALSSVMAQDKKVAVFDPAGNIDNHLKEIVREEVSSIIVNAGGYTVLERQLINKVLEENRFQMGGLVDDSQVAEIGKLLGANLAFVSNITPMGSNFYISCKLIDVQTGRIDKQQTAQTQRGTNDLIGVVQGIAREMFVQTSVSGSSRTSTPLVAGVLAADGNKVYQGGRKLTPVEVRSLLATTEALQLYNKGQSQYNNGRNIQIAGITTFAVAGIFVVKGTKIDDSSEKSIVLGVSIPFAAVGGVGGFICGTVIKGKGKTKIDNAVNIYNRSGGRASKEFDFGFTGNGVGMVMRF